MTASRGKMRSSSIDFAGRRRCFESDVIKGTNRRSRLMAVGCVAVLWSMGITWRLFSLQVSDFETWQDWAIRQHFSELEISSERGPVLDRNEKLMAVSVPAGSIYARPRQIVDKKKVAKQLAPILGVSAKSLEVKLESKQPFVWIKRQLPRYNSEQVTALDLPGIGSVLEARRFYPYNQAASALIGRVGIDGAGLSGVESLYESKLHVGHLKSKVGRDAFGKTIQEVSADGSAFSVPKGDALRLTIDADLQIIMDEEVQAGREAAHSKHAMAIMADANTGEILALSQAPSFNFNLPQSNSKEALHNLLVEAVFEPGSTMKPIVAAAAIEEGVVRPDELINCENGRYPFGKHTIKDAHPSKTISFHDVVVRSSNIGMTKVGVRLGAEKLYGWLRKFGFGGSTSLRLSGETSGILRPVSTWSRVDVATHSFGQGIAVTPLQMVRAVSAIANGGVLPELKIVMDESNQGQGERILTQRAARIARDMMFGVVEDKHGTGSKAKVAGLRIGGKTGTAQKAASGSRGYQSGVYVASFIGFADLDVMGIKRTIVTMVIIDEPKAASIYGGILAAPVFEKIVSRSSKFLATRRSLSQGREPQNQNGIIEPHEPLGNSPGHDVVAQAILPTSLR